MPKQILITGAAGFLGSRMADWIIANHPDVRVVGIDDLSGGWRDNVSLAVEFFNKPCRDLGWLFAKRQFDVVLHFAAYAAEGLSPFIRKYNYANNVIETASIINHCIESGSRLVFTSSVAVYGHQQGRLYESTIPSPADPYGIAKYACELDLLAARQQHGLDYCILRPHNLFGAKQNLWDTYRNVLGIWMRQKLDGQPLRIFGDGSQTRQFTPIDDCLEPIWQAATLPELPCRIYNLGSEQSTTVLQAAQTFCRIAGQHDLQFEEARHEALQVDCDHRHAREVLGYTEKTSFEDCLRHMWEWAQSRPTGRQPRPGPSLEITKGLYPAWH